jgi:hypothetical protein
MAMLRRFIGERISVASRGVARQAIFTVQPAQNRRRKDFSVFWAVMTGGHEPVAFASGRIKRWA